jgi:hypothetical protein
MKPSIHVRTGQIMCKEHSRCAMLTLACRPYKKCDVEQRFLATSSGPTFRAVASSSLMRMHPRIVSKDVGTRYQAPPQTSNERKQQTRLQYNKDEELYSERLDSSYSKLDSLDGDEPCC